jgi:Domain of unknown function (DUF834).
VGPTRQPLGPRWTGRTRLAAVGAVGPARQPHPRARAADGRAPPGSREGAPEGGLAGAADGSGAHPRPDGRRRRPTARRSGTRERGGKGEANGTAFGSPRSTTTTETAVGAEGDGGAAREDDDDVAPAVDGRSGAADGVGVDAAMPKEGSPSREEERSDGGG